ncbi:MAG: hypothetical protein WA906_02800, partial [Pacificimonas sp.]
PFPSATGRLVGPLKDDPTAFRAIALLYAAMMAARLMVPFADIEKVVVSGPFAVQEQFTTLLKALLRERKIELRCSSNRRHPASLFLRSHHSDASISDSACESDTAPELLAYYETWRSRLA